MAENQFDTTREPCTTVALLDEKTDTDKDNELIIWDRSDPGSLINMLPPEVALKMESTLKKEPDLFSLDEQTLSSTLRKRTKNITATDNRLRLKFWSEYDLCKENGTKTMVMARVMRGICSKEFFYKYYLREPGRIAWLLCPPINYMVKANEALEFGLEQMRDILATPHTDLRGRLDARVAALKITIFKLLEDRIKGSVVQKTESKNVSLNYTNLDRNMVLEHARALSEDQIAAKIRELEYRERKALHLPDTTTEKEAILVVEDEK
jgi:hypothetical protein